MSQTVAYLRITLDFTTRFQSRKIILNCSSLINHVFVPMSWEVMMSPRTSPALLYRTPKTQTMASVEQILLAARLPDYSPRCPLNCPFADRPNPLTPMSTTLTFFLFSPNLPDEFQKSTPDYPCQSALPHTDHQLLGIIDVWDNRQGC